MTRKDPDQRQNRLRLEVARLGQHLADVATAIAYTEDQVAETLERMALVLPEDAARLLANAARARRYATLGRGRAARFAPPA